MGIKFGAKMKVKHNFKRFNTISDKLIKSTSESIEDVLKTIRGYAIRLERRSQRTRNTL